MRHFKSIIYKVGINAVADVPQEVTHALKADKGYIRVTGTINGFGFRQTLVPVKGSLYRLFVNIPMLEGGGAAIGDNATFTLMQDEEPVEHHYPMNKMLQDALENKNLQDDFNALTASRKREILKYLAYLKAETTIQKNVDKVVQQLEQKITPRIP